MSGVPKGPPIKLMEFERANIRELVENTPLKLTGTSLKNVLDNPDVRSSLVQRE